MQDFHVRPVSAAHRTWVEALLTEHWGSAKVVTRGRVYHADELPGFVAESGGELLGLVTYRLDGDEVEVATLNSLREGIGIGTALLDAVRAAAQRAGCRRMWLITTNDNMPAFRFYQKRGWRLVAVHREGVTEDRRLKPEIPPVGLEGIPLRDEIEFEFLLIEPQQSSGERLA